MWLACLTMSASVLGRKRLKQMIENKCVSTNIFMRFLLKKPVNDLIISILYLLAKG
jgi:hypothetical protein